MESASVEGVLSVVVSEQPAIAAILSVAAALSSFRRDWDSEESFDLLRLRTRTD